MRNTWIVRHWRGELSLPVSYWVNTVLLPAVAYADLATVRLALLYSSIYVWSFVGTGRAAQAYMTRHRGTRRAVWGGLASFIVAMGVLGSVADVVKALAHAQATP